MAHTEYCFRSDGDWLCSPGCTHDLEEAQAAAHKKLVEEVAHWKTAHQARWDQLVKATGAKPHENPYDIVEARFATTCRCDSRCTLCRERDVKVAERVKQLEDEVERLRAALTEVERRHVGMYHNEECTADVIDDDGDTDDERCNCCVGSRGIARRALEVSRGR